MANHGFGQGGGIEEQIEIDAGRDPKPRAQERHLLGRHVAGRAGMSGKRTASEAADCAFEAIDPLE
jgi:hypothetical protein